MHHTFLRDIIVFSGDIMQHKIIRLDSKERQQLNDMMEYYDNSLSIKNKVNVILMRSRGTSIPDIIEETNLSKRTIINYVNQYLDDKRFFIKNNYSKSDLEIYKTEIKKEFKKRPPKSYKEATLRIKNLFGIERSVTQVREFLTKNRIYTARTKIMPFIQKKKMFKVLKKNKDY